MLDKLSCATCKYLGEAPTGEGCCERILECSMGTEKLWLGTVDWTPIPRSARIKINFPKEFLCMLYEPKP